MMRSVGTLITRASWALIALLIGWLGESGHDGGFIKDIWGSLKVASPPVAMILFFLLLDERRERREAQQHCSDRTMDFTRSTNTLTNVVSKLSVAVTEIGEAFTQANAPRRRRK